MASKQTKLSLLKKEVSDEYSRENFERIEGFIRDEPLLKGKFKFFELVFSAAVTNMRIPHNLGFLPKDAIITYRIPTTSTVTLNQNLWTDTFLDITTSAAVTIRAFIGTYGETGA